MLKKWLTCAWDKFLEGLSWKMIALILAGAAISSFGIHNIHQQTGITEGGVIGLMLLLENWFGISPAFLTPILDGICYLLAFRFLGGRFIKISLISTVGVSLCYKLWEMFPPMLPDLSAHPFAAAVAGGLFVGIGVGLIVRQGGSAGGDDALALVISHGTKWKLSRCYMFTDFLVLGLSLTYIPLARIAFSVVTVMISSQVIDWVQEFDWEKSLQRLRTLLLGQKENY